MNCPRCRAVTLDDANYCQHCGAALTEVVSPCPACGTALVPGARYCHECGQAAAHPSPRSAAEVGGEAARLQKFIPKELLTRLEAARHQRTLDGERRVVSILFCDVKGSTAMAEKLDPEEWADVMNEVFEYLIRPVYQYEGMVARLMGDAILAFFGAPIAHEDDPERAVLAGLGIVEGIQACRERLKQERGLDFNVRVGINTGLAVVGEVGSDLRVEYTAMGDAVNLAARMEQTAQPGTVQISGYTYKLIAPLFECESLGGIEVKGKSGPVPAYRVLRPKTQPGRLRGIEGLEAPLVGRESEWATLREVMAEVRGGRGRIIALVGEAGLGKSRLIQELRAEWERSSPAGERVLWGETRSASYAALRPYGQFQQLIRSMNGIGESDAPEAVRVKIARAAAILAPDQRPRATQLLEVLLAVESASTADVFRLEGEAFKTELASLLLDLHRAWTSAAPSVVVFDDLHWADPASLELLTSLFALTAERPILFVSAFRPDPNSPAWRVKQIAQTQYAHCYIELPLGPLSTQESATLVSKLLDVSFLPPALRELILRKTEGNPFFVEEVVRSLIDSGAVVREAGGAEPTQSRPIGGLRPRPPVGRWSSTKAPYGWQMSTDARVAIPDNVQALLTARIDRLDEAARHTLQLAAVIGHSFDYRVLQTISEAAEDLDEHLTTLQRAELIRETAPRAYSFRHALTQETAYQSILLKRRREFHLRVGEALETLFADRLAEVAPVLGHHFYEAHQEGSALKYLTQAGDLALRLYANAEAAEHYGRALEVAGRLPDGTSEQFVHLYLNRGQALELNAQYDAALTNYVEMETLAQDRDDPAMRLKALIARAKLYCTPNPKYSVERGQALSEQALALARDLGDRVAEARILWSLMLLTMANGQIQRALTYGEQTVTLARRLDLREQLAFVLNDIQRGYAAVGEVQRAQAALAEAQTLWRELDNRPMLVDNLASSAVIDYLQGNWERALAMEDEALRVSQAIHNLWGQASSRQVVGYVHFERGEPDKAIETLEDGIRLSEGAGHVPLLAGVRADLGWMYGTLGAVEYGLDLGRAALAVAEKQFALFRAWPLASLARLHCLRGDLAEAQAAILGCRTDPHRENLATFAPFLIALAEGEFALLARDHLRAIEVMDEFLSLLRRVGVRAFLSDSLCYKGQALLALGRADEAHQVLVDARAEAEALGSRRSLWVILFTLSRIEAERGSTAEADRLRQAARGLVKSIADRCPPTLRSSFLNLPQVCAVLGNPAASL